MRILVPKNATQQGNNNNNNLNNNNNNNNSNAHHQQQQHLNNNRGQQNQPNQQHPTNQNIATNSNSQERTTFHTNPQQNNQQHSVHISPTTTTTTSTTTQPPTSSSISSLSSRRPTNQPSADNNFDGAIWKEIRVEGKKQRVIHRKMLEDGNCLFRAIADQVYGDQDMHGTVRKLCMDFLQAERDHYSQFVTEEFESYLDRKRKDKCFGNNVEIQASCEIFNRPIEVYTDQPTPLNIFQSSYSTDNAPIRLSYNGVNHYDSLVDPYAATIGVGLGLPEFKPGLADKMHLEKAMKTAEDEDLERRLVMDLQAETDWEVTEKELEEAAIAASLAEYWQSFSKK